MSRTFDDTREMAESGIGEMERQLAIITRTYNRYMKHGAVNAAAELQIEMEALDRHIQGEQELFRMTFF